MRRRKVKVKKKGFSLIELLAVIVILAVILMIAVPGISNYIRSAEKNSFRISAENILKSVSMANVLKDEDVEYYYVQGKEYTTSDEKLEYDGKKPQTGRINYAKDETIAIAIHNGKYCATKAGDQLKVTVEQTGVNDCITYTIIETSKTWQEIAIEYDTTTDFLLGINEETDINSPTTGRKIKVPIKATSVYVIDDESTDAFTKTYYSLAKAVYADPYTPNTYTYTIELGVLPIAIDKIHVAKVIAKSIFVTDSDFEKYVIKSNLGEVKWPAGQEVTFALTDADDLRSHAADNDNMLADDVSVSCDTVKCTATITETINNSTGVNPYNTEFYLPVKFTVEFNGEPEVCAVSTTTDETPGAFAGTGTSGDPYLVESIEDLVYLSNTVNAGTTYSSKYLTLTKTFDFNSNQSYKNYQTTIYGDINGNGTTEELKTELTTSSGFKPIGMSSARFNGNISGNDNCIKNLYINRPTTDYVGLFGYNTGTISTIKLMNGNITGRDYTGSLVGLNYLGSKILDSSISGEITGNNNVGGIAGGISNFTPTTSVIVNANITGVSSVGGLVGDSYYGYVRGIMESGSITATGSNIGRTTGSTTSNASLNNIAMNTVTVNGSTVTNDPTSNSTNGQTISSMEELNDINLAETSLDTYIGGDTDGNGWYWDLDGSNKLVHKKVIDSPLTFTLSGSGTSISPYLITSADDLRMASLKLDKVYSLANDIDLNGVNFYMLGSYATPFTGTIIGNYKTISNLTINTQKTSYVGLIGYSKSGTIKELNMNNSNITGRNYVGSVIGGSDSIITLTTISSSSIIGKNYVGGIVGLNNLSATTTDSSFSGNVTGANDVGGIAGGISNFTPTTSVIVNANITGVSSVGGLVGDSYYGYVHGIMESGSIIATGSNYGRTVGSIASSGFLNNLAMNTVTVNGSTIITNPISTSTSGQTIASLNDLNEINLADVAIDTYIGGDNDGNGWYWDLDGSNNLIHKKVADSPLTFTLSGSGTDASPYLITSADDLKMACLKLDKVYALTTNLDLNGVNFYMLGSYTTPFTGKFNGKGNAINNLTINSTKNSYVGFSGYNKGTIKGLNLTANITGRYYIGGVTGYNDNANISDINFNGNTTGYDYVGLVTGTQYLGNVISVLASGNVTGNSHIGGLTGYSGWSTLRGIMQSGTINGTGTNINRSIGNIDYGSIGTSVLSSILVNGLTRTSASATSVNGLDITSANLTVQTTYTDRGFNFTDETLDYIWYLDAGVPKFRAGNL